MPTNTLGMVSVHDHKRAARALVLCEGSMRRVPAVDAMAYQQELPYAADGEGPAATDADAPTLF
ncbi:hypothetical protein [Streptomyces sp. NPDC006368]|uniref:hypothetical protein n=1 Tax=Streptomyces sp. NPDC006368 TaxID=3156760 RepID=UPI0033A3B97A